MHLRSSPRLILLLAVVGLPPAAVAAAQPFGHLVPLGPAADGPASYRFIAALEAARTGVPYALVDAVMKIESDYRPDRIGEVGEIGLMQVRPSTAALLGYRGDARGLAAPETNIRYGTAYLARAWELAHGNVCRALMKYRAGHGETSMSDLSATYCSRARDHLLATGSPLARTIEASDLVAGAGTSTSDPRTDPGTHPPRSGRGFWARFEARVHRINARIEARWRRVAARD